MGEIIYNHIFVDGSGRQVHLDQHYEGRTPEYRVTMTTVVKEDDGAGTLTYTFKHYVAQ